MMNRVLDLFMPSVDGFDEWETMNIHTTTGGIIQKDVRNGFERQQPLSCSTVTTILPLKRPSPK
jgi:hypothetical protein